MCMTKSLSYMPARERDMMAVSDCATPPAPEITTVQAHVMRTQHAGHPSSCIRKLARSREENGARHEIPYAPPRSASNSTAATNPGSEAEQAGTV
ncbi:hypothetical protein ABIA39_008592 [Nocardia sp. GAS34]